MFIDRNTFQIQKMLNRLRAVRAYNAGDAINPSGPIELIIEITNYCNLACVMCPRVHMERKVGYMELDLFKKIIDQVKDSVELVYIAGGLGEPIVHPRLKDMLRYCIDNDVRVGLSTNASLLSDKIADILLDTPPHIMLLSLDGATKQTHEAIRVGSTFEKTMANVERFLVKKEERKQSLPYTVCQMIYMPKNQTEAEEFDRKWRRFKAVDDVRLKKFLHLQGADYVPDKTGELDHQHLSCILPWRQLAIAFDGTMALCCRDLDFKDPVGSVKDTSIAELWNGERMQKARTLLASRRKSELPICRDCPTIKTTSLTRAASVLLDNYSIRKALPIVEKLVTKFGLRMMAYD